MSRRFYLLAAGLLLLALFGLMLVVTFYEANRRAQDIYYPTDLYRTGGDIETAIHATETAKAFTATPLPNGDGK